MSFAVDDDSEFEALSAASRDLHGHQSVLPVAIWILRGGSEVFGVSEIARGVSGRLDRPRIIEALERLESIGAMQELPRVGPRNSARMFERKTESPYWEFASSYSESRVSVGD